MDWNDNDTGYFYLTPLIKCRNRLEGVSGPGDSGAPAYITVKGKLFVAGVSSRSRDSNGDGIEPGYGDEDLYTRVSLYEKWIKETISLKNKPTNK